MLDSVRAARDLPDSGASDRFAVWGHSQGGHAALYTGELAERYAPDLKLVGVATAGAGAVWVTVHVRSPLSSPTAMPVSTVMIAATATARERRLVVDMLGSWG